jgi:predicted metal-dependent HD superfamily phosphohydrolase
MNGQFDGYHGDSGRSNRVPPYDTDAVLLSDVNLAIQSTTDPVLLSYHLLKVRFELDLSWCRKKNYTPRINCSYSYLFDL